MLCKRRIFCTTAFYNLPQRSEEYSLSLSYTHTHTHQTPACTHARTHACTHTVTHTHTHAHAHTHIRARTHKPRQIIFLYKQPTDSASLCADSPHQIHLVGHVGNNRANHVRGVHVSPFVKLSKATKPPVCRNLCSLPTSLNINTLQHTLQHALQRTVTHFTHVCLHITKYVDVYA